MILKQLSEAIGVSGKEDAVRAIVLPEIAPHASDIQIDALGGISAIKRGSGASPLRLMVAAHMDEVGFMVRAIDSDGLIRVSAIGGIDERILPGMRVRFGKDNTVGAFIWTPIHQNREQTTVKLNNLRIDIGASSKDEAAGKVAIGDVGTFDSAFMEIGARMLRGKAFDDRAGCALLIDALKNEGGEAYPVDVLAAFTVQEEIGLRGARVAAQRLMPDIALILESTTAHDVPNPAIPPDEAGNDNPTCRVGGGPVLSFMDRSLIVNPRLLAFLRQTADEAGIPYQFKTQLGGGTDGGAVHVANAGVPTAVISLPCRYIHSPSAYLHRDDYDAALRLIRAFIHRLPALDLRDRT